MMKDRCLHLCLIGNLLGRNSGHVTTQGQIIADLFVKAGYDVASASSKLNRVLRMADVAWTIFRNRRKIDVLILEVYSGLSFILADAASFLSRLFRIPAVFVLHGGNLPEFARNNPNWVKRILKRADILVAPSTFLATEMAQFGFQVRIIPNVIPVDNYPKKVRIKIFPKLFWMRSFHSIYNPQMALDVFACVKRENPGATLVMAGADKGLEDEIKNKAVEMGLRDSVRFTGFLDENSKIKEMSEADVYLNTNRVDNMPVSIIEACAMGLPVVATDVGGISHLITNRKNGMLVPDGDANAMADAIRTLLTEPDLTELLSKNGRLLAERSAWTNVRPQWLGLFDELTERRHQSSKVVNSISIPRDVLGE